MDTSDLSTESGNADGQRLGDVAFPVQRSNVYLLWLEEKQHIERNRWFLSEKLGIDCGWSYAKWDWEMRFRKRWLEAARAGLPFTG